jgi:hypothetical protein
MKFWTISEMAAARQVPRHRVIWVLESCHFPYCRIVGNTAIYSRHTAELVGRELDRIAATRGRTKNAADDVPPTTQSQRTLPAAV